MAQILLKLCQGHLSDETKWKAPYNHGSKVHHSLVRAISIFSLVHFCWWDLVKIRTGHPELLQQKFFSQMAQIWRRHDQDLCVSSIWAGDGVLGTLVTNWAQPRSFPPKPSSTSQRCNELWDRNLKSLNIMGSWQIWCQIKASQQCPVKRSTTSCIPRRSPIQVLTRLNVA